MGGDLRVEGGGGVVWGSLIRSKLTVFRKIEYFEIYFVFLC